jgi:hypothetical protein
MLRIGIRHIVYEIHALHAISEGGGGYGGVFEPTIFYGGHADMTFFAKGGVLRRFVWHVCFLNSTFGVHGDAEITLYGLAMKTMRELDNHGDVAQLSVAGMLIRPHRPGDAPRSSAAQRGLV